jgi:hypothetical protein
MAYTSKILAGIVAVLVIGFGGWWYMHTSANTMQPSSGQVGMTSGASTPAQTTFNANANGATPSSDTSDSAMAQDATNIDGQMNGLTTDNANTDQGLNSQ